MTRSQLGGRRSPGQEGFTLIEAVMATGILIVGLVAISNLMFVAISSNSVANWTSGAAFLASQRLEQLRSVSYPALLDSLPTSLDTDQPGFNEDVTIDGLGVFHTRWRVQTVAAVSVNLKYLAVQTEMRGPLSRRTRAEFTTLRAQRP
jgi:Tfp pilus assembly protein PilV